MYGLIEFVKLPRGTYRAVVAGVEIDVWQMGGGVWKWSVLDSAERVYITCGESLSLDSACDDALRAAKI